MRLLSCGAMSHDHMLCLTRAHVIPFTRRFVASSGFVVNTCTENHWRIKRELSPKERIK